MSDTALILIMLAALSLSVIGVVQVFLLSHIVRLLDEANHLAFSTLLRGHLSSKRGFGVRKYDEPGVSAYPWPYKMDGFGSDGIPITEPGLTILQHYAARPGMPFTMTGSSAPL